MARPLSPIDRLRIERVVWLLDQRLLDLPHDLRVAHRRETRLNLHSAAGDVGVSKAIKNLGDTATLAAGYLTAHFGDRPRHSWIAAVLWAATSMLVMTAILADAAQGFADGLVAADAHATGTFHWSGLSLLQSDVTVTATDGATTVRGGTLSPAGWLLWAAIAVAVGRLWRWRRRSAAGAMPAASETNSA